MSTEVFEYVKGNGGRVSVEEAATAVGRTTKSVNANVTDLTKKGLAVRDRVEVEGQDKPVVYIVLTEEGKAFVQSAE